MKSVGASRDHGILFESFPIEPKRTAISSMKSRSWWQNLSSPRRCGMHSRDCGYPMSRGPTRWRSSGRAESSMRPRGAWRIIWRFRQGALQPRGSRFDHLVI